MISYPLPIAEGAHRPRASKLLLQELRSGRRVGASTCPLRKCKLRALWLECASSRSKSFAQDDDPKVPQDGDARFCFAPGEDDVTIWWTVENPDLATGAMLELYRAGHGGAIWRRALDPGEITAMHSPGWMGALAGQDALFPAGLLTVEHGPYLLRMVLDGDTEGDQHTLAWTWAEVVVHEVSLSWGRDVDIPRARPDIALNTTTTSVWSKVRTAPITQTDLEQDLLRRERELLAAAANDGAPDTRQRNAEIDLTLDVGAFDGTLVTTAADLNFMRTLWGDGPSLPIFARATIRRADGTGIDRPALLGRAAFVWEWRDNDTTTLDEHLESWLGDPADIANPASRITRRFLRETYLAEGSPQFPRHAFNCPESAGGKRGRATPHVPARPVFPAQPGDGEFPFEVAHPLTQRTWAAVSYADAAKNVLDRNGALAHTGALFQPTSMAGDRYRLAVYPAPGGWAALDTAPGGAFVDLETEAPDLPFATTPFFHIWRGLKATYLYTHSFAGVVPGLQQAIAQQYRRELGFNIDSRARTFPDLTAFLDDAIAREVAQNGTFQEEGKAALLQASRPTGRLPNSDYALDVETAGHRQALIDLVTNGDLYLYTSNLTFNTAGGARTGEGCEFSVVGGATRGLLLPQALNREHLPPGLRMLVVPHGAVIAPGDVVKASVTPTLNAGPNFAQGTLTYLHRYDPAQFTVRAVTDRALTDRQIEVWLGGMVTRLDYPEGTVRPTRKLSDARTQALDAFMARVFQVPTNLTLDIEVRTRSTHGREGQRATHVVDYLNGYLVTPAALGQALADALANFDARQFKDAWRHILNWALQAWVEQEDNDLDTAHRAYFGLHRGKTLFDERFVTGGIESDITTLRVGLASVNVPVLAGEVASELRWLKDVTTVGVHEFGHALMLKHASPRLMDSKEASGIFEEHLAHDGCLMNYDADTSSFCALCILRKRGWDWRPLVVGARGVPDDPTWIGQCEAEMREAIRLDDARVAMKVRLAMFLVSRRGYDPNLTRDEVGARTLMSQVLQTVGPGDPKRVWALRNMLFFLDKLRYAANIEGRPNDVANLETEAVQHVDELYQRSQFALDVNDLTDDDPARANSKRLKGGINGPARWKCSSTAQNMRTATLP